MPDAIPAVLYAAKSTEDEHGSIPDQLKDGRTMAAKHGWTVIAEKEDENKSAYKGNRGKGLAEAKAIAIAAADEAGEAMLVIQHSDRLARGSGEKNEAQHFAALYFELKAAGVRIRSFQDDDNVEDPIRAVLIGERNHEDSKRKALSVKDGKRRRAEAGGQNGPLNFGYRFDDPDARKRRRVHDDAEVAALRHTKVMLEEGATLNELVRWLNANGFRSKQGNTFVGGRVRSILENPYYVGRVKLPEGGWVEGDHDPVWTDAEFAELQVLLLKISRKHTGARGGRNPDVVTLFSGGVVKCAGCGKGVRQRTYKSGLRKLICSSVLGGGEACDCTGFPAQPTEEALLKHFGTVFVNLQDLIDTQASRRDAEREVFVKELEAVMAERDELEKSVKALKANFVTWTTEGDTASAKAAAEAIADLEPERDALAERAAAAEAKLDEWTAADDTDEVLDWWTDLSEAIRNQIVGAEAVAEANAAIKRHFVAIYAHSPKGGPVRLDFILREQPPGSEGLVSSSLWIGGDAEDDYWPEAARWSEPSQAAEGVRVNDHGSHS